MNSEYYQPIPISWTREEKLEITLLLYGRQDYRVEKLKAGGSFYEDYSYTDQFWKNVFLYVPFESLPLIDSHGYKNVKEVIMYRLKVGK